MQRRCARIDDYGKSALFSKTSSSHSNTYEMRVRGRIAVGFARSLEPKSYLPKSCIALGRPLRKHTRFRTFCCSAWLWACRGTHSSTSPEKSRMRSLEIRRGYLRAARCARSPALETPRPCYRVCEIGCGVSYDAMLECIAANSQGAAPTCAAASARCACSSSRCLGPTARSRGALRSRAAPVRRVHVAGKRGQQPRSQNARVVEPRASVFCVPLNTPAHANPPLSWFPDRHFCRVPRVCALSMRTSADG